MKSYTHPAFIIEPVFCPYELEYTYTKLDDGRTAISQDSENPALHTFSWNGNDNDDLFYPYSQTENVKVTATSTSKYGSDPSKELVAEDDFDLDFRNPCLEYSFSLEQSMIEDIEYPVGSGLKSTTHQDPFVANPPPAECGPLKYKIEYNSTPVTTSTEPMAYENLRPKEIDVETDDTNLIGTKVPYKITVELENWPTATYPSAPTLSEQKDVIYVSACANVLEFTAGRQAEGQEISYDTVGNELQIVPHTIKPDYCKVEYECSSVTGPTPTFGDSLTNLIDCNSITTDLTCEEENLSDCDIKIPIDPSKYPDGGVPPGEYCVTISGCNPAALVEQCEDTTICVTLVDPCDPPQTLQASNLED